MWSRREPIESVPAVQAASTPAESAVFEAFVRALTARAKAPFAGPDPECAFSRFGVQPHAVLVRLQEGRLVVRGTSREPEVANSTLHAFLEALGERAATDAGIALTLSPAAVAVPPEARQRWLMLPRSGELEPCYRAHVPLRGEAKVHFEGWATEPIGLPCMGGHEVRFHVWDAPADEAVPLIDAAIQNMREAGPELLEQATEHVYRYYRDVAENYSAAEREDYGIPTIGRAADVWQHVQLDRGPSVAESLDDRSGYLHAGVAYVSFECECDWEPEHGLCLVFIDGKRLGRVSSYDGHSTWAHAYADRSLLDVIYREGG